MAALDWIFAAVLLASMLIGAWRGLVFELLSLAGWVVAFFLAQWWAAPMAAWLPMGEAQDAVRHAAGFAVVFVLAVAAVAAWTPLHEADWWQQSQVAPWMVQMLQGLRPALPEEFGRHLPS